MSGTKTDKREDFNRLLADCRKGKIDRVLVKSISRFSRNTKDCLAALRELMRLGVTVQFEKENIDTGTLTTELMVSVSGSLAQQESMSISQNIHQSYRRRMERGEFITTKPPYGYRLVNRRDLEIVPEEAEIIRWVFDAYLGGQSAKDIANELIRRGVRDRKGNVHWTTREIYYWLSNEKYVGDTLCQKTYKTGFPFVQKINRGEVDQFYVEGTHPAIVSQEVYDKAQALRQMKKKQSKGPDAVYPLSRKMCCGICGFTIYRRVTRRGTGAWSCGRHLRSAANCPTGPIPQETIYDAFLRMYNKLRLHNHIVFNSVSFTDGIMYRNQRKDYFGEEGIGIRGTSDAICQRHNLSVIEPSEPLRGSVHRAEWEAVKKGKPALSLKTRRANGTSAVRPGPQGPPAATQRAAGAARRQVQRKMLARPKKAIRSSVEALRRIARTAAKAVSTVTSAVTALIGGGILLTALVIVIVIAAVANSPFGLFYAQEPNAPGTVSVAQAVGSVKEAYNAKLEELQTGDYDSIDIQGQAPDWTDVLAVFAVKLAGADVDGLDVATLDPDRVSKLTAVFWDMTAITTEVETIAHPASGNREAWTEKILHITITPKTADDMRTIYNFTPYQNSALDELLGDRPTLSILAGSLDMTGADEREVLAALPADLEQARRDTVEKALSLVGKVNYFWGGKSHAIGWDDRWGTLRKVTAAGSPSMVCLPLSSDATSQERNVLPTISGPWF